MTKLLVMITVILPSLAFGYDFGQWTTVHQEFYVPQESYSYTTDCPHTYAYDDDFYCDYDATTTELYVSLRQNELGYVAVFVSYDNKDFSSAFESNVPLECGPSFCANPKLSASLSWVKKTKSSDWETTSYEFKYTQGTVKNSFTLEGKTQ